ncbi:hypothetical protein [Mucilaginibacter sp. BT774]|uniref:hypothetical protein n=1 Tax=Mucilaginibacter sp. BT774 TaxID=3062276 RepID=UPI002675C549|nr:hypothetical protein [Mucilaginibacter sp. BT774]MDO3628229.1 hypothetical protein [Mucilaginibacter sp. BT774]
MAKSFYTSLVFLLNLTMVCGQQRLTDTSKLAKYSYLIYGCSSSGNSVQATGFFVKKKNHTFLVTASHVVNGWLFESFDAKGSYPDTLFIKIGLKNSHLDTALAIDISDLKHIKADPYSHDIYFIPVNIPASCQVYRLDSLILNYKPISHIPHTILTYGFAVDDQSLSLRQFEGQASKKAIVHLPDWNAYSCSPLVYEITYSGDDLGAGDSGSPAYFITEGVGSNRESVTIQFGGLLFGGNPAKNRASVIRPELVKALYDKL